MNPQNLLVSIVLPTYNGAKYLKTSLQSILAQTYPNWELMIIDDCSTDNTPDIAKEFVEKDNRIKYYRNESNLKLPLSLNKGFSFAKGAYFTWTSDDNYYANNAIETMVSALNEQPDKQLVYANYTTIDDNGNITGTKIFGDVNKSMVTWLGCGACFMYHSDIHEQLKGYDASAFLIEDYDFFIRALTKTKFIYLPVTNLYFYRLHSGSLTSLYGFYNFDLQKIVVERRLPDLLKVCSNNDKALWFRKYAIYYGVHKSNYQRMQYYLKQLSSLSLKQSLITKSYILAFKTWLLIKALKALVISFFK